MISLIDSTRQIILAEATQSLSLVDDNRHAPDDHIWLGNISIPRADAVCEHVFGSSYTARETDGREQTAKALVVPDLRLDERFKDREYVSAERGIRFYAGVPITASNGSQIGVYAVSSDQPRASLNIDELMFMQDVATTVYEHLEMVKSQYDRDRGERMVNGLASFIEDLSEGKHRSSEYAQGDAKARDLIQENVSQSREVQGVSPHDAPSVEHATASQDSLAEPAAEQGKKDGNSVSFTTTSPERITAKAHAPKRDVLHIFQTASRVLLNSTKADGCIFFDTGSSPVTDDFYGSTVSRHTEPKGDRDSHFVEPERPELKAPSAHILGVSTHKSESRGRTDLRFQDRDLQQCIRRYPCGQIFSITPNGWLSSSVETISEKLVIGANHEGAAGSPEGTIMQNSKIPDQRYLHSDFFSFLPGARSVVFLPLFDCANQRWFAGGFLWTTGRGSTQDADTMPYLRAFGSCIMSEVSRMEAVNINRAKTTFIASISHELRSPLHGILGSTEFLQETLTTAYQMGLIGSIETCGKTLLDTIDHLLDHAKINNLTKIASGRPRSTSDMSGEEPQSGIPNEFSTLTTELDLSCLVEDVIEAVFAGQTFRKARPRGQAGDNALKEAMNEMNDLSIDENLSRESAIAQGSEKFSGRVIVVLNVEKAASWWVKSQPGGIRRVVMNIFGNSLKYCSDGAIELSLSMRHLDNKNMVVDFLVKDTGRGISKDFMEKHLFEPFSQEDSFAHGTGLGLSIVKQIVTGLDGKVEVKSQKNLGTEVRILLTLPVIFEHPKSAEAEALATAIDFSKGKRVCLLQPDSDSKSERVAKQQSKLTASVAQTCRDWFEMEFLDTATLDDEADVFIYAEPPPIDYLLEHHKERRRNGSDGKDIALLIICTNAFEAASLRATGVDQLNSLGRIIEVISQPVGPRKLAKVLLQCLRRVEQLAVQESLQESREAVTDLPSGSEVQRATKQTGWTTSTLVYDANIDRHRPALAPYKWRSDPPVRDERQVITLGHALGEKGAHNDDNLDKGEDLSGFGVKSPPESVPLEVSNDNPFVLLVDDNPINLKLLVTFMKKSKLPFEEAVNGLEALEKYKASKRPFDYVLMDISMPVMDGLQSTSKIREWESEKELKAATIIALTGLASSSTQQEAFAAGISHFLTKPLRFKTLQQLLVPRA